MGIRFACHTCGKHLNIKNELAGRRGICPSCSSRFRIPTEDTEKSTPVEEPKRVSPTVSSDASPAAAATLPQADSAAAAPKSQISSLDILTSDPTSTWYVRPPNGGQYGPATGEILRQWIAEGRVATTALLWRDGWPQWREASEALPELAGKLPDPDAKEPNASGPTDGGPGNPSGSSPSGSPGVVAANNAATLNNKAATPTAKSGFQTSSSSPASSPTAKVARQTAKASRANGATTNSPRTQPVRQSGSKNSAAIAAQERAALAGEEFGYEDSVFASNNSSYTSNSTRTPKLHGRDDVGQARRARATRRTLSIVLLGIFSVLLIAALIIVTTR